MFYSSALFVTVGMPVSAEVFVNLLGVLVHKVGDLLTNTLARVVQKAHSGHVGHQS